MSGPAVAWSLAGSQASLACGPLEAVVQIQQQTSIIVRKWNARSIDSLTVFASAADQQSALQPADSYVRGTDLVVDYCETEPHRIAPQIYWRAACEQGYSAVRMEMVISVRTELLDSVPTWSVESAVGGATLFHTGVLDANAFEPLDGASRSFGQPLDQHLFVFRQTKWGLSYAEMVHPSDFISATVTLNPSQALRVRSKLFAERMEKGVIRRGRICGWFMPAEGDLQTAVVLARQFLAEPLPLTA